MDREELLKSVDSKVDEYFAEDVTEETVEKSSKDNRQGSGASKTSADEGEKPKKAKNEEDGENGRPKDPSNMNKRDAVGDAKATYDKDYTAPAKKQAHETTVAKSETADPKTYQVSEEDYAVLQKAKESAQEEVLQKARDEQATLLKSVITEAIQPLQTEIASQKEDNAKMAALVKSMKEAPQPRKAVTNVNAIEKSFGANEPGNQPQEFQKAEVEQVLDELHKAGQIKDTEVIEYDMTQHIQNPETRAKVERKLQGK